MSHYSMPITLAPCLSRLSYMSAPFFDAAGRSGFVVLDVEMNHIDIEFREAGDRKVIVDHSVGKVMLEMPANLSGSSAEQCLLDERGLATLKLLTFTADLTDAGVAIRSPSEYSRHLAFMLGRAQDLACIGAEITLDAATLGLAQLNIFGLGETGNYVNKFASAVAFIDRETGLRLDTQEAADEAVAIRSRDGLAHGILLQRLDERFAELLRVTTSNGKVRAWDEPETSLRHLKSLSKSFSSFMKKVSMTEGFELTYDVAAFEIYPAAERETIIQAFAPAALQPQASSTARDDLEEERPSTLHAQRMGISLSWAKHRSYSGVTHAMEVPGQAIRLAPRVSQAGRRQTFPHQISTVSPVFMPRGSSCRLAVGRPDTHQAIQHLRPARPGINHAHPRATPRRGVRQISAEGVTQPRGGVMPTHHCPSKLAAAHAISWSGTAAHLYATPGSKRVTQVGRPQPAARGRRVTHPGVFARPAKEGGPHHSMGRHPP